MSPQRKGLVRPTDAERMQRAVELRALAELELADAVVTAMKHGGSIREVAAVSGLSEATVMRWRQGKGLPSHDDWHRSTRERREALYAAFPWLKGGPSEQVD